MTAWCTPLNQKIPNQVSIIWFCKMDIQKKKYLEASIDHLTSFNGCYFFLNRVFEKANIFEGLSLSFRKSIRRSQ